MKALKRPYLIGRHKKTLQKEGFMYGAPGAIRTPDRSVRSRVLYPAELQALWGGYCIRTELKVKQKSLKKVNFLN